jgi:SAM-dependent methyltransferase
MEVGLLAANYWSAKAITGYAPNWFSLCAEEITHRITGQAKTPTTTYLLGRLFGRPVESLLELGCLSGDKLAKFLDTGLARSVSGVDVAAAAIERGREKHSGRVDLSVMDLNDPEPLGRQFEVIHANGVLHHIENLERCADWIAEHLQLGGVLLASEFTGPVRYRYSRREIDLINEGVAMLPVELRESFNPISLSPKLDADPSESIRSRDICDVLRASGLSVEARPYGGNVLQRALGRTFFGLFKPRTNSHVEALESLVRFDEDVTRAEPSHHCFFIARHISAKIA